MTDIISPKQCRHSFINAPAYLTANNDATNGLMFRVCHSFLSRPVAVRAVFYNHLSTLVVFAQHYAATAHTIGPALQSSTAVEWTAGGAVSCAPANDTANSNPSITYGPWVPVYGVESVDDPGTYPVMVHAVLQPAYTEFWTPYEDQTWRASEPKNSGLFWTARQQSGSDPLANPGLFSSTTVQGRSAIAGIEAICEDGSILVADCGDSITAGAGQTDYGRSDIYRAISAINQLGEAKVSHMRGGFGGQNSLGYFNRAMYLLPVLRPDILIFSMGSPNDGIPSLGGQRTNWSQCLQVIELARSLGTRIILRGWAPHSVVADNWPQGTLTYTPGYPIETVNGDVYRQDTNARGQAMNGQGLVTWTPGPSALGDGAKPERYITRYTDDTNHPNDAGYAAITPAMQDAVMRALMSIQ
ncbi:SGNH/GDSL hydrolase family protein [Paraburkholderia sp. ZP32-5]|uniref:SGNH/GDSL hydrolase family protein n=1 Tax=Paraburkholderia sp. ZP32-5 TaxID=2883245 RepID=UPI001F1892E2|nr:SGNH/GDSL hydrolase family protein [Paraburkholderia sp. ZP32-5]